jgi:predicted GNAT superfamily acetyltransferase
VKVRPKELKTLDELKQVQELMKQIFDSSDLENVSMVELRILPTIGGKTVGIYASNNHSQKLAGFMIALPNSNGGMYGLHAGILPEFRKNGYYTKLCEYLFEDALKSGKTYFEGTFDPMLSENCYIYFHKFHFISTEFLPNFYGSSGMGCYAGHPTDRLHIVRFLRSEDQKLSSHRRPSLEAYLKQGFEQVNQTKTVGGLLACGDVVLDCSNDKVLIHAPSKFREIKRKDNELALNWRKTISDALDYYLNKKDFTLIDYVKGKDASGFFFVLKRLPFKKRTKQMSC